MVTVFLFGTVAVVFSKHMTKNYHIHHHRRSLLLDFYYNIYTHSRRWVRIFCSVATTRLPFICSRPPPHWKKL